MLFLHNPTYLLASAEKADLVTLRRGVTDDKFVQQNKNMLKKLPDRRVDATYNGWWTCLIPAEVSHGSDAATAVLPVGRRRIRATRRAGGFPPSRCRRRRVARRLLLEGRRRVRALLQPPATA